jgi:phosphate transport system substrate-binding protein
MRRTIASAVAAFAVTASLFAAAPANAAEVDITGSGSSFANNFVVKCAGKYQAATGNKVAYTSTGSGTGRKNLAAGTSDYAFSDAQYGAADAKPSKWVTVPVIGGAVAIVFNVAGVKDLNLDAATLGGIFDGSITTWNDPKIVKLNKKAKLPASAITVVYRNTKSGTTQNLQNYLQENIGGAWLPAEQAWKGVATGASVALSTDMAYKVAHTDGAIGYVDLSDIDTKVGKVALKNAKGKFVKPSIAAASKFLSKQTVGSDGTIDINFTKKVTGGYQLSIVTYMMIPDATTAKGAAAKAFGIYAVTKCSKKPAKGYAGFGGSNFKKALFFANAA